MRKLFSGVAVAALMWGCAGKQEPKTQLNAGPSTVRLPLRASMYVRAMFDSDGTSLIGAWVPDGTPESQIDESTTARTRCSDFIRPREVQAGGRSNEVFGASQSFGGNLGVPNIAKLSADRSESDALRIDYELTRKLVADVDQRGLQACCRANPRACQGRYITQAVAGKGFIYAATEKATNLGGEGQGTASGIPFGVGAFYKDGLKWERRTDFDGQYFAFGLGKYIPNDELAACSWVNKMPTSLDGEYFVGVATPRTTEQDARENATENAEMQVIAYMGKWLGQQSTSTQRSAGAAEDMQTVMADERSVSRMTEGLARFVKVEEYCPSEELTPQGKRYGMKALAFLPNDQRDAAARLSIANLMAALREQNKLTPERQKQLEAMMGSVGGDTGSTTVPASGLQPKRK